MCLAKAYSAIDGQEELILEDVARLTLQGDCISLQSLFGELKEIEGRLLEVDFQRASITIGPAK